MTQRSMEKYLPQMGDRVVLLVEGHCQYWEASEMTDYFDAKYSPLNNLTSATEPVVFALVTGISWHVGPPAFCRLKLRVQELVNFRAVMADRGTSPQWTTRGSDITLEYSDEDGCPEFLVLWERFRASMAIFFGRRTQRVDAMYDVGKYTGQIAGLNETGMYWQKAKTQSPWACYHIIW